MWDMRSMGLFGFGLTLVDCVSTSISTIFALLQGQEDHTCQWFEKINDHHCKADLSFSLIFGEGGHGSGGRGRGRGGGRRGCGDQNNIDIDLHSTHVERIGTPTNTVGI